MTDILKINIHIYIYIHNQNKLPAEENGKFFVEKVEKTDL